MTTPVPTIGAGWDVRKVLDHLATLTADAERAEVIAEAFSTAADEYYREAATRRSQLEHSKQMFSQPKDAPA